MQSVSEHPCPLRTGQVTRLKNRGQFGDPDDPMVGPTAGPIVPVFDVVPVGPAPSVVSGGITMPRRCDGGGTGSPASTSGACASGGGLVAHDTQAASRPAAAIERTDPLAIGKAT
jgi:hypothetical protein